MSEDLSFDGGGLFLGKDDAEAEIDQMYADGINRYIALIRGYPVLTKEKARELILRSSNGDASARDALVMGNLRLVLKFARKIHSRRKPYSLSFEDLVQAGNLGVMDALDGFDPERFDTRFSTYAVWHIEKRIWEAIHHEDRLVRFPVHMENRLQRYSFFVAAHVRNLGRSPTIAEIIEKLGLSPDEIHECRFLSKTVFMSLDEPIGSDEDGITLAEVIPSDEIPCDERFLWSETAPMIEAVLECLSPDDREILCGLVGVHAERKLPAVIAKERGIPQRDVTKRGYAAKAKVRLRLEWRGIRKRHFL
jgi:RNA polymerase sigma factor (sigma-70 family)